MEHVTDDGLIGIQANDLTTPTHLFHLAVRADANDAPGGSSYGMVAKNSPGLVVFQCKITAGAGGRGADGTDEAGPGAGGDSIAVYLINSDVTITHSELYTGSGGNGGDDPSKIEKGGDGGDSIGLLIDADSNGTQNYNTFTIGEPGSGGTGVEDGDEGIKRTILEL
jgi:hypothetical protein